MASRDVLNVNMRDWDKAMAKIQTVVLPKTAREVVNAAAFAARPLMSEMLKENLDRATPFTLRPWQVGKAKASPDLDSITATIKPLDLQEKYLSYQLFGGERHGGDPGAWPKDVPVSPSDHQDKHGNRVRSLLKQIGKAMAEEKALRKAGFVRLLRLDKRGNETDFEGTFFGSVGGVRGYYKRPRRKNLTGPKKKGVRRWTNIGSPDLLIAVYDETKHKEKLRGAYDKVVDKAWAEARGKFGEFFAEQLRRAGIKK